MFGKHHVVLESKRLKYEFDIKRNITVILGESATGKTTMLEMLAEYRRHSEAGGVRLEADVPCIVYADYDYNWKNTINAITESIVFIDEDYPFVFSDEFASVVEKSSNYFVLITRRPLYNIPYSIEEVYGIRTTGNYHFPEKVYNEFYKIYDHKNDDTVEGDYCFVLEDSKSGFEFYKNAFGDEICRSSGGNANIPNVLAQVDKNAVVIADGAAFGAYMEDLLAIASEKENVLIYLPESFEWLILKSGIIRYKELDLILDSPEKYIDSQKYMSWERYFTALLTHITENDPVKSYSKVRLCPYYYSGKNKEAVLNVMPKEIRQLAVE